jgi:hypothetical protein
MSQEQISPLLQIEQSLWTDFLMKQAPVIIVLGLISYFMYKYFISQQDKKDATIKEKDALFIATITAKDEKIDEHQQAVMELYGKAIEAQNRGNMVQEQLLEVLKETKDEVNKLSDKIK